VSTRHLSAITRRSHGHHMRHANVMTPLRPKRNMLGGTLS